MSNTTNEAKAVKIETGKYSYRGMVLKSIKVPGHCKLWVVVGQAAGLRRTLAEVKVLADTLV